MLAPVHTKNTARMGSAPVNSAPVNEPKNFGGAREASVASSAPHNSGHHHQAAGHAFDGPLDGYLHHLAIPRRRG